MHVSLFFRALLSLTLLIGFYVLVLAIALGMLVLPVWLVAGSHNVTRGHLVLFPVTWTVGVLLLVSLGGVRAPRFAPEKRAVREDEAPELFALLRELAALAETTAPLRVYLTHELNASVTYTGGAWFGVGGERVLLLGVPLIMSLSVAELRAVLSHELGHFVGGDHFAKGPQAYAVGVFQNALQTTQHDDLRHGEVHWTIDAGRAIARVTVEGLLAVYARVFFVITGAMSRRQEVLADQLAARLAGGRIAASALRRIALADMVWSEHARALRHSAEKHGVMPRDCMRGFIEQLKSTPPTALRDRLSMHEAHVFDAHPPPAVRIRALDAIATTAEQEARATREAHAAESLFVRELLLDVVQRAIAKRFPHELVDDDAFGARLEASITTRARKMAADLFPYFPQARTLQAIAQACADHFRAHGAHDIVNRLYGAIIIADVAPAHRSAMRVNLARVMLTQLFEGALVERGAQVELCPQAQGMVRFVLAGKAVDPAELVDRAAADSSQWEPLISTLAA